MAYQPLLLGTSPGVGPRDSPNSGGVKINANFVELYAFMDSSTAFGDSFIAAADAAAARTLLALGTASVLNTGTTGGTIPLFGTPAASVPGLSFTSSWFSGGTTTTTKPAWLLEPTGTTSTAWSTSGTGLGVNAATGFGGNLLDLQINGSSKLAINSGGDISTASNIYLNNNKTIFFLNAAGSSYLSAMKLDTGNNLVFAASGDVTFRPTGNIKFEPTGGVAYIVNMYPLSDNTAELGNSAGRMASVSVGNNGLRFGTNKGSIGLSADTTAGNMVFTPSTTGGFEFGGTGTLNIIGKVGIGMAKASMRAQALQIEAGTSSFLTGDTLTYGFAANLGATNYAKGFHIAATGSGTNQTAFSMINVFSGSGNQYGMNFETYVNGTGDSNGVAVASGNTGSGAVGFSAGIQIFSTVNNGGGSITNAYGLYIKEQTAGSNNWAIRTLGGLVDFDGNVRIRGTNTARWGSTSAGPQIGASDGTSAANMVFTPSTTGGLQFGTAGVSLKRIRHGNATLVAGTVTVSDANVTASSLIFLTCQTPGGTPGWLQVSARTASTSFTILSSNAADTSTVGWLMIEP